MIRGGATMIRTGCGAMMRTGSGAAASICAMIFAGAGASMIGTFGAASRFTAASCAFTGFAPLSQLASRLEPTITTV